MVTHEYLTLSNSRRNTKSNALELKFTSTKSVYCIYIIYWSDLHRRSCVRADVILNLLKVLGKSNKMWALSSISTLFCNKFETFYNTGAPMLYFIDYKTLNVHFWRANLKF